MNKKKANLNFNLTKFALNKQINQWSYRLTPFFVLIYAANLKMSISPTPTP